MATAKIERENAANGKGPLGKAADDEPVFILRGRDELSADLVELWAIRAKMLGCNNDKVNEAYAIAEDMRTYPGQRIPD